MEDDLMDDGLEPGLLAHLDDAAPPAFGEAGAAAAVTRSHRRRARAVGGAGMAVVLLALAAVALVVPRTGPPATTLAQPMGDGSTTIPADQAVGHEDPTTTRPGLVIPLPTMPTLPPGTVGPTLPPPATTSTSKPGGGPTTTPTTVPTTGAPRGDVAPRPGIDFTLILPSTTMHWDQTQQATARLVNNSKDDLYILSGCGVTYASVYDGTGTEMNDHSRSTAQCNSQTGYFGPGVVHPGETKEAIVPLVAQGPGNPEAAEGFKGVPPGRYNAYASWALDSRQAGKIDYMYSRPVVVDVVGQ
jgi:hypothetical protein